jgi:hypothetical protein
MAYSKVKLKVSVDARNIAELQLVITVKPKAKQ